MEPLWSAVVANGGNRRQIEKSRKPQKQAKTVAVGCDPLPETYHGKQGVCGGLPPVAAGPLPAREGVDLNSLRPGLSLAAAVRARAFGRNHSRCRPCGSWLDFSRSPIGPRTVVRLSLSAAVAALALTAPV
jgi:hypothetical protein